MRIDSFEIMRATIVSTAGVILNAVGQAVYAIKYTDKGKVQLGLRALPGGERSYSYRGVPRPCRGGYEAEPVGSFVSLWTVASSSLHVGTWRWAFGQPKDGTKEPTL